MNARLPRAPLLVGRVLACGIWVDLALVGPAEAQRRVLGLWRPGARLFEVRGGYLLLFDTPRVLFSDDALGTVVAALPNGGFTSCALSTREQAALTVRTGSWVWAHDGQLRVTSLDGLPKVDPARWLDLGPWTVAPVRRLERRRVRDLPDASVVREDLEHEVRALLGSGAPVPSAERDAFVQSMEARRSRSARGGPGAVQSERSGSAGIGVFERLRRLFGAVPTIDGAPDLALPPAEATPEERGPGWWSQVVRRLFGDLGLARLIGRQQAKFLQHTMRLFESGDLDEALRHAVPLSSLPGSDKPPSLSIPSPRMSLELHATSGPPASSSLYMEPSLLERFKAMYRDTARRLEAAGRIEEAAYVYFELLSDNDEGIAALERHGNYALAATMAHGRGMSPGLIIRLWFLAKQADKAILVAKRTGAFADAIARLQSSPEDALRLRLLWGDRLAQAGDYAAAADAVWPAPAGRALARAWIDRAIDFGGRTGARMLARKLQAWSDDPQAVREAEAKLDAWLLHDDASDERVAFATAWSKTADEGGEHRPVLDRLVRRLMHDGASANLVNNLLSSEVDAMLRLDVQRARAPEASSAPESEPSTFTPDDRGLLEPTDAVVLPNGQWLVALGEAGLQQLAADGRVLRHYRAPTTTIVLADSGMRAILLHPRGEATQLSRLEVDTGRHTPWVELKLERWAARYDGASWFVCDGDRVLCLDVQSENLEVLWSVGGLPGPCVALTDDGSWMRFAVREDGLLWVFRYEHTDQGLRLRGKTDPPVPQGAVVSLGADGTVAGWSPASMDHGPTLVMVPPNLAQSYASCDREGADATPRHTYQCLEPTVVVGDEDGLLYGEPTLEGTSLRQVRPDGSVHWRLEFIGSANVGCHLVGARRVLFDQLGRVAVVTPQGKVERVIRTRL